MKMTLAAKLASKQKIMANAKREIAALRAAERTKRKVGNKRLISLLGKALLESFNSVTRRNNHGQSGVFDFALFSG